MDERLRDLERRLAVDPADVLVRAQLAQTHWLLAQDCRESAAPYACMHESCPSCLPARGLALALRLFQSKRAQDLILGKTPWTFPASGLRPLARDRSGYRTRGAPSRGNGRAAQKSLLQRKIILGLADHGG